MLWDALRYGLRMALHAIKKWLQHSWNHFMYGLLYFRDNADLAEDGNLIVLPLERLYDADDHDYERRNYSNNRYDPTKERNDAQECAAKVPERQTNALVCMMSDIVGRRANQEREQ